MKLVLSSYFMSVFDSKHYKLLKRFFSLVGVVSILQLRFPSAVARFKGLASYLRLRPSSYSGYGGSPSSGGRYLVYFFAVVGLVLLLIFLGFIVVNWKQWLPASGW